MHLLFSSLSISLLFATSSGQVVKQNIFSDIASDFTQNLQSLITDVGNNAKCGLCTKAIDTVKSVDDLSSKIFDKTATQICSTLKIANKDVCAGMVSELGPSLTEALKSSHFDKHLFCAAMGGWCTYPEVPKYSPPFPKPMAPSTLPPLKSSGKTINVLHLSDWHFDSNYLPGSEAQCSTPLCCNGFNTTKSKNISRPAASWGDYNCDQPFKLGEDLLKTLDNIAGPIDFAILTGDIPAHNVWNIQPKDTSKAAETAYGLLHKYFDPKNVRVFPAIGNHETAPVNQFSTLSQHNPPQNQYLFDTLAKVWKGWLPDSTLNKIKTNGDGSYSVVTNRGLKIISLNTILGYKNDFYAFWNTQQDPNGIFQFLINELQASEDLNQRVWIIMHIPPGIQDTLHAFSHYYNQILARYNATIAGQFSGHTHRDEYASFVNPIINDSSKASINDVIGNIYIGPSVTPYTGLNPGYRIYKIDTSTFQVMDSLTYIADLSKSKEWDEKNQTPNWHLEYSARESYGKVLKWPETDPLNEKFWWTLSSTLELNQTLFDTTFWEFRSKSSGLQGTCDETCRKKIICALKNGRSDQLCNGVYGAEKSGRKKRSIQKPFISHDESWNKDLCNSHFH